MSAATEARELVLQVENLHVQFVSERRTTRAVDGVSFALQRGEILGIVGESGSGKSVTCLSLMGLVGGSAGRVTADLLRFRGVDLMQCNEAERRRLRGSAMAMVFQDPMSSLNPYLRIGEQLIEGLTYHLGVPRAEALSRASEILERVGIADGKARLRDYPHQLSGGMRQRVLLAMGLLTHPELLILDEPTTALDVSVQAQILDLLESLRAERELSAVFITHDLGVVARVCDRVLVMYAGRVVEEAPTATLFSNPSHPYTRALLESLPDRAAKGALKSIDGLPPRLDRGPFDACTFMPRCALAHAACAAGEPKLYRIADGHFSRCVLSGEQRSTAPVAALATKETPHAL